MNPQTLLFDYTINYSENTIKHLQILLGDLCQTNEPYDVLICSAFKNDYLPIKYTLIGGLFEHLNISVDALAKNPEINLKEQGCWVSHEIDGPYKRIACVELLDYTSLYEEDISSSTILTSTFSTLKFMLEELSRLGKPCRSIALPILGTGNQNIELCYIIPPLLSQCTAALKDIPQLEKITFYEQNEDKAAQIVSMCKHALAAQDEVPHVFISYSTKQQPLAYTLKDLLTHNNISCWMAPESIPAGSNYQAEIPVALSKIPIVLLVLSPDAEKSRWVQKEIGCTIGAKHTLIPYKQKPYIHTKQFNFLLNGEQIFEAYKYPSSKGYEKLIQLLKAKLDLNSIKSIPAITKTDTPITTSKSFAEYTDFELLDFLTHCAFDPAYQNQKHILDLFKKFLDKEL